MYIDEKINTMRIMFKSVVIFLVIVISMVARSDGETYEVGDASGWTIPTIGATSYSSWAVQHTFLPGDKLVFNFTTGAHDVAKVDKTGFDSCTSATITNSLSTSPATIILTSISPQYFICTFSQHCLSGQKLSVKVSRPSPSPPTLPPAPAPISIPTQMELGPAPASIVPTVPLYASPPAPIVPEAPLSPLSEGVPGPGGSFPGIGMGPASLPFPPSSSATSEASSTMLCMIISIAAVVQVFNFHET